MNILGLSAYYHDSAASLLRDGVIVAAAQEERFTRKKNDEDFPEQAIRWCLAANGLQGKDIDFVAFYDKPFLKFERLLETYLTFAPKGFASFRTAMPVWMSEKLFQKDVLLKSLKAIDPDLAAPGKLLFAEHHLSHAASAFYPSPFEDAAVLTMDGVGEWATTSAGTGRGDTLIIDKEIHFPHSLGLLYAAFTYYTGFKINADEYKVMGLAPYGEPKYAQTILDNLIDLKSDGSFRLNLDYFDYCTGLTMTNAKFDALFGGPPRDPKQRLDQRHMDLAASVQAATEEAILRLGRGLAASTGMKNLCLAGGVALNCVANGKLLRDGCFESIFIQPAAGDAGGAIGAALAAYHIEQKQPRRIQNPDGMSGGYLGPEFSAQEIHDSLDTYGAVYRDVADAQLFDEIAAALDRGEIVGWFQGRMEFGPRALGNRSILGDARSPRLQRELNMKIKYRESFRPFAPVVPREDVSQYFELDADSPYMLLVAPVKAERRIAMTEAQQALQGIDKLNVPRSDIPAVTHIDYSARVQTVRAETNARFYRLLDTMRKKTGSGVLVNTSFNVRDEPIVCTPEDAYRCFMACEMDVLVVGNTVLRKDAQLPALPAAQPKGDGLVPDRLLACLKPPGASDDVALERTDGAFRDRKTGVVYPDRGGVPSLLLGSDRPADNVTAKVNTFYEAHPSPNYDGVQEFGDLVTRGTKDPFFKGLLDAIGYNKLILDCGCGTGQMSHLLSLNNNHVLGVDLSIAGLKLAIEHKLHNEVPRAAFAQMDLFDLGVKDGCFDVVVSSGVLHHTGDPRRAFAAMVRKAKPGGLVLVGLHNRFSSLRSMLSGGAANDAPGASSHSLDELLEWFRENDLDYLNCQPAIVGSNGADAGIMTRTDPGTAMGRLATELSWLVTARTPQFVMTGRKK